MGDGGCLESRDGIPIGEGDWVSERPGGRPCDRGGRGQAMQLQPEEEQEPSKAGRGEEGPSPGALELASPC